MSTAEIGCASLWGEFVGLTVDDCRFENLNTYNEASRNTDHAIYISGSSSKIKVGKSYFKGRNARVHIYNGGGSAIEHINIDNNFFDGVKRAAHFNDCANATFAINTLKDSGVIFGNNGSNITISGNSWDGQYSADGTDGAVVLEGCDDITISGNTIVNLTNVAFDLNSGSAINNLAILNNNVKTTSGGVIELTSQNSVVGVRIIGNYFKSGTAWAIKIAADGYNNVTEVDIIGNTLCKGTGGDPIYCLKTDLSTYRVQGNRCNSANTGITNLPYAGKVTLAGAPANVTFPGALPSTNYYISLSCNADETIRWSSKATTGFTITSSNGSSTASVDFIVLNRGY